MFNNKKKKYIKEYRKEITLKNSFKIQNNIVQN